MLSLNSLSHILLWIIVTVEGLFLLALARQIGILHLRHSASGARVLNAGPNIGETIPPLDVNDVNGRSLTLGAIRGKRTLLLFTTTSCGACASLLPQLKDLARNEHDNLEIILIAFGTDLENGKKYAQTHSLDPVIPFAVSDDLALLYKVTIAPYGLLVDRSGVLRTKGLVNSYFDIESLLNAEEAGVSSIEEFVGLRQKLEAN